MLRVLLLVVIFAGITARAVDATPDPTKIKLKFGDRTLIQTIDHGRSTDAGTCSWNCPVYGKEDVKSKRAALRQTFAGRSLCSDDDAEKVLNYVMHFEDPQGLRDELTAHLLEKHRSWTFATEDGKPIIVFAGGFGTGKSRMAEIVSTLFSYRWREDMRAGDALVDFKCSTHVSKSPAEVRSAFFEKLEQVAREIGASLPFVILLDDLHVLSAEQVEVFKPLFDRDRYYGKEKPSDAVNKILPRSLIIATVDFGDAMEIETVGGEKRRRMLRADEIRDKTHRVLKERFGAFIASRIAVYPMPSFGAAGHRRALQYKLYTLPCAHRSSNKMRCFFWTARSESYLLEQAVFPVASSMSKNSSDGGAVEINGRLTENVFRRHVSERLRQRIHEFERRKRGGGVSDDDLFRVRPGEPYPSDLSPTTDLVRRQLIKEFRASQLELERTRQKTLNKMDFLSSIKNMIYSKFEQRSSTKKQGTYDVAMYVNESKFEIDFIVDDELLDCSVPQHY